MKNGRSKEQMLALYKQAKDEYIMSIIGIKPLCKKYNISSKSFTNYINKLNINKKTKSELSRKYNLNEKYFDNIDSEEKAYILGLLYADGSINKKGYLINISLKEDDKSHLDKINKLIGSDKPLYYIKPSINRYSKKGSFCLNIQSKYIYNIFIKNEYLNRNKFPDISGNLIHHFIRGVFDGDGCISIGNRKCKKYSYFSGTFYILLNNKDIAQKINKVISEKCNVSLLDVKDKKGNGNEIIYEIKWSGTSNIINIFDWLYKDASIYLDRKYLKFIELRQSINCRPK